MKRILLLVLFLAASRVVPVAADTLSEAAALAAQRDAEERYKRLSADVQSLFDAQEVIQKRQEDLRQRLDKLADEIRTLKDDQNRSSGNLVTRDEFRKYVEKLKELDEKRESDKKLILESIKDLAKVPVTPAPDPRNSSRQKAPAADSSEDLPYIYVIKKNDRLLDIIAAYNDYFQKHGQAKITKEQVLKANPGLKPDHLIAGSKLRIPVPPSKDNK